MEDTSGENEFIERVLSSIDLTLKLKKTNLSGGLFLYTIKIKKIKLRKKLTFQINMVILWKNRCSRKDGKTR